MFVWLPKFPAKNFPGARAIVDLPRARAIVEASPEPSYHHSSPWSRPLHVPPSSSTRASDTIDHAGAVPKPTTPFLSPQQCRPPGAHDTVHPHHSRAYDTVNPCYLQAPSAVVLPEPVTPSSPWCPRAYDTVEPASSLSPQCRCPPWAHKATLYIFLCHFGPTNPNFDMLHCHIVLICYIAFVLLHCHIALICYIATLLWYTTLLLFCCIALIVTLLWYDTLPLTCCIALICYISTFLEVDGGSTESSGSVCVWQWRERAEWWKFRLAWIS
jgi:hypothetical protein